MVVVARHSIFVFEVARVPVGSSPRMAAAEEPRGAVSAVLSVLKPNPFICDFESFV